uniref:Uncharacterized protein n=1 Tax=Glossina palpalis gambiensis TaxID=67801 RepID=A0A1B0BAB8_9MUSC
MRYCSEYEYEISHMQQFYPGDRGVGFMSPEPIEVLNACRAICRCRITCSFRARSLLYIGPNLFLPPRIRSALTAVNS